MNWQIKDGDIQKKLFVILVGQQFVWRLCALLLLVSAFAHGSVNVVANTANGSETSGRNNDTSTPTNEVTLPIASSNVRVVTTNVLEQYLHQVRSQDVTAEYLANLYSLRTNAPNTDVQVAVIKACGAGLLYLGKVDAYQSKMRPLIPHTEDFEKMFFAVCKGCNGSGEVMAVCSKCNGSGHCTCNNGINIVPGFDRRTRYLKCPLCNGTGKCSECSGTGQELKTCPQCHGRKGRFDPSLALAECKTETETAIADFDALRLKAEEDIARQKAAVDAQRLKAEEDIARQQFEKKKMENDLLVRREAALAEAKATGEERAKQAAIAEQTAAEQKRRAEEEAKYTALDGNYLKSTIVVEGEHSVGTGFLCNFKGKRVAFSNAHVLCGNRTIRLRTISLGDIPYTNIYVCRERDIVAYELTDAKGLALMHVYDKVGEMNNQEPVVVFGNSAGGGVVTTLRGKMQGVGPEKIEVDATFVQGNSGSPIIAYPYNSVVGMATYLTREPEVDWAKRSTRFAEVRRFGVRVDNIGWDDFFPFNPNEYNEALDVFEKIESFAQTEIMKSKWQGDYYHATGEIKTRAATLLNQYRATPEWMRKYADDAALAAYVCVLVLK